MKTEILKSGRRREALKTLSSVALAAPSLALFSSASQPVYAASNELQVLDINSSMSLITGAGSNVLVKKTPGEELIVVDGGLEANARSLRSFIRKHMGSRKFNTLINTHWHPEQTGLNRLLSGSRIFSHENTRLWLGTEVEHPWEDVVYEPLPKSAQPNATFYHYGEFTEDNTRVLYGYLRQAHTDGDTYVFFPEDNVLHTGGVISNDGWPVVDWWTGGWIGGLVDGIETLLQVANQETVIVPASGPVMSYSELVEMRDMYVTIYTRVRSLFMEAKGPQETLDAKPTAEFDARFGDSDLFVLLAYQSVLPHLAPDA